MSLPNPPPASQYAPSFATRSEMLDWARLHRRRRSFSKDERITARAGLLYWVDEGVIRLMGLTKSSQAPPLKGGVPMTSTLVKPDLALLACSTILAKDVFLGFVTANHPFELASVPSFSVQAYAHVEATSVLWLYWEEVASSVLYQEILEVFRYQHQRKLLWLSILGQKRTVDRLIGFLRLLVEEFGEQKTEGYCLPYPLTHAQIGSAIGATRVTVTRLIGRLREEGVIVVREENGICLNAQIMEEATE